MVLHLEPTIFMSLTNAKIIIIPTQTFQSVTMLRDKLSTKTTRIVIRLSAGRPMAKILESSSTKSSELSTHDRQHIYYLYYS